MGGTSARIRQTLVEMSSEATIHGEDVMAEEDFEVNRQRFSGRSLRVRVGGVLRHQVVCASLPDPRRLGRCGVKSRVIAEIRCDSQVS